MAENTRIRIEPHIENYLKSHAPRIIDKSAGEKLSVAELSTIANTIIYEHKQAQKMMGAIAQKIPLANFFNWLMNLGSGNKVIQLSQPTETPALSALQPLDNFDFDADFAAQFEQNEAA